MPDETTIRIGQIWQQRSHSFPASPLKRVVGFDLDGRVLLQVVGAPYRNPRHIKVNSLIGQRRRYRLVQDVETKNPD